MEKKDQQHRKSRPLSRWCLTCWVWVLVPYLNSCFWSSSSKSSKSLDSEKQKGKTTVSSQGPATKQNIKVSKQDSYKTILARSRELLIKKGNDENKMQIACDFSQGSRGCQLIYFSDRMKHLQRSTPLRKMLSFQESEGIRLKFEEESENQLIELKADVHCAKLNRNTPPFPAQDRNYCEPANIKKLSQFEMSPKDQDYYLTLLNSKSSTFSASPNWYASIECKYMIYSAYSACHFIERETGQIKKLEPGRSQSMMRISKKNWLIMQRLSGAVGPIIAPKSYSINLMCFNKNDKPICMYQFT